MNLSGKTAAVLGVADRDSIAWSIAQTLSKAGAKVTIGYQQRFLSRVRPLLLEAPGMTGQRCDVLNADEVEQFFAGFKDSGLDILVHSIAYGPETAFTEPPSQFNSLDFNETLEISTHSLSKVVKHASPYLNDWSSVMTLTFQASQRAMPMYGMMGVAKAALESLVRYLSIELGQKRIRVNAISAGPVETLAALSEIIAFKRNPQALERLQGTLLKELVSEPGPLNEDDLAFARRCWSRLQHEIAKRSAIPEILNADDIANTALFLASDSSKKITGQVIHVDCGLSTCQLL